jgi:hypothetical protein
MLSLFQKDKGTTTPRPENQAHSYIGVAAVEYGVDYDLTPLISGKLDRQFQAEEILFNFAIGNKKFDNFVAAMKHTSKRGISSNSAFVIGLKCSVDEINIHREKGKLSNLIISITNATTNEPVTEDSVLLKSQNKDSNNSDPRFGNKFLK